MKICDTTDIDSSGRMVFPSHIRRVFGLVTDLEVLIVPFQKFGLYLYIMNEPGKNIKKLKLATSNSMESFRDITRIMSEFDIIVLKLEASFISEKKGLESTIFIDVSRLEKEIQDVIKRLLEENNIQSVTLIEDYDKIDRLEGYRVAFGGRGVLTIPKKIREKIIPLNFREIDANGSTPRSSVTKVLIIGDTENKRLELIFTTQKIEIYHFRLPKDPRDIVRLTTLFAEYNINLLKAESKILGDYSPVEWDLVIEYDDEDGDFPRKMDHLLKEEGYEYIDGIYYYS